MPFKIRQLEAFRAIADSGSVTKAAARLGVSQPAVSRLMTDFSREVGFELFHRRLGVLKPTSDARYLLSEVKRVLDGLDHLDDLHRDITERTGGHIRIACLPGFATSLLPKVMVQFLQDRPGVTVTLEPDRPERILEWIIGQQYDCGITDGFIGHPATESQDLHVRTVCILPKGHPLQSKAMITPEDLAQEKMIHTRRDSRFFYHVAKAFSDAKTPLNSLVEVRQFTTACTMVAAGMGASIVSALDAEEYRSTGIVVRPFLPEITHKITILRPASGARSPVVLDFIDSFLDSVRPFLAKPPRPH
ncbi:MAG: LysR substrate-binding domain-containing protein [Shimia sp.]|uniref:LysR substrate-binding domain-containing protein n=1 Tax=Shimia sp. TaxID=1954381 RepID=UPI0040590640